MTTTTEKRIYGIDALRAVAMMLGIVLHASIAYKVRPHRNWIHDGEFHYWLFDYGYFFIHSFRMPLFFLIAGFFARLVYYKSGEKKFIQARWKRVGLPFVVALLLIVPVSLIPYNIYTAIYDQGLSRQQAYDYAWHRLFRFSGLAHLWFLYDLLLLYAGMLLMVRFKKLPGIDRLFARIDGWVRKTDFARWWWAILFILPMWLLLLPEKEIFMITDTYLIPRRINNLAFYGYFFVLGWLIQKRTDLFAVLMKHYLPLTWTGLLISAGLFAMNWQMDLAHSRPLHLLAEALAALQVFFLVFGSIGLFLHYFKKESRFWKYISDASYWVYLVHLVIVTSLQFWFLGSPVPGLLRFPIILIAALSFTFLTYQYFVRYSFIGNILHGPRQKVQSEKRKAVSRGADLPAGQ